MSEQNTEFERSIAIREGHKIHSETSYFTPRPQLDFKNARHVFGEGFDRGYIAATTEANKRIAELEGEVAELKVQIEGLIESGSAAMTSLKASNNHLREALQEVKKWFDSNIELEQSNEYGDLEPANSYSYECYQFVCFINQALSATPAESLQAFDDMKGK